MTAPASLLFPHTRPSDTPTARLCLRNRHRILSPRYPHALSLLGSSRLCRRPAEGRRMGQLPALSWSNQLGTRSRMAQAEQTSGAPRMV
eukprot:341882-Hanusia_phi.AAC.1